MKTEPKTIKVLDSYLKLIRQFPLRPIRNHREYDLATSVMEKLVIRSEANLDAGERDYLDALDEFVSIYDQRHFSFPADKRTPLARLKYLLSESGTSPSQLRDVLGCSQPLVSMILTGARELSKENIRVLWRIISKSSRVCFCEYLPPDCPLQRVVEPLENTTTR